MIVSQSYSKAIADFILSSAKRLKKECISPMRAFGIQCSAQDRIILSTYDNKPERADKFNAELADYFSYV
jgi:uncharacterized protein (DUF1778 family)